MLKIRGDWIGRLLGILVFVLGVGIMWIVFREAHQMFNTPLSLSDKSLPKIGHIGLEILKKLGLLIVMTLAGSLIANKGVQMYFAALGFAPHKALEQSVPKAQPTTINEPEQ